MAGGSRRGYRGHVVDGRFELLEQLGAGGMGTVWRARDTALDRDVALKEVRPPAADPGAAATEADDPDESEGSRALRERVLREARALARLSHPHVVTIHHIVDERPYPWLVMELVRGPSLEQRLAEGPLAPPEAARLGRQVLAALVTAHAAGIQHRDVKPGNILLRERTGEPGGFDAVLTDFGIAGVQGSTSVTATGEFVGSPEYTAPERIRGDDEAPSGDLWSLGLTLYVCTEGRNPMRRATSLATIAAVLDDPVPPPARSGGLGPVLQALLVEDPAARPGPAELDRMLADVAEGRAPAAHLPTQHALPVRPSPAAPPPPGPTLTGAPTAPEAGDGSARRGRRRRGLLATVGAVVAAALVAGGAFLLTRQDDTGRSEAQVPAGQQPSGTASPAPPENGPAPSDGADQDGNGQPDGSGQPGGGGKPGGDGKPGENGGGGENGGPGKTQQPPGAAPPVNSWVAQLGSLPKSRGPAARERMQADLRNKADTVRWLDSNRFASLRAGYWVFFTLGPSGGFPSGQAAADWCKRQGLGSAEQCLGRYVSHDKADHVYLCSPDKSRGTGRCRR
ncbi:serine/threonine-protein kinase [Streptomyces cacaoi]|uniref:serine/threonine-protein kinase n=1 Tax=Streptomyces cacaoi TaxID=1898 RepID=UPI003326949E